MQRLGTWLAVIGALIGFAVVAVLIWVLVAVINPFGS